MKKSKVIVSRKWDNVFIEAFITEEEIGISVPLEQWIFAVIEEIGNPTLFVTKGQLKNAMLKAAINVEQEAKKATVHVI